MRISKTFSEIAENGQNYGVNLPKKGQFSKMCMC